jgi:hypothetical protein
LAWNYKIQLIFQSLFILIDTLLFKSPVGPDFLTDLAPNWPKASNVTVTGTKSVQFRGRRHPSLEHSVEMVHYPHRPT